MTDTKLTAILPQHIDSTMISCFRSCPQKFNNEFNYGLRPAAFSIDLHAGACVAVGIEAVGRAVHEGGKPLEHAFAIGHGAFLDAWGDFEPQKDTPKTKDRCWESIEEYFAAFPPLTDHIQPYFVNGKPTYEFTFAVPLEPAMPLIDYHDYDTAYFPLHPSGQPFIYCGRLDRLGQWGGKVVGQDEKTTKSISSNWSDQWNLRSQFIGYCWALRQSGLAIDTIAVRGIGILKTKITIVEAIKTYSDMIINRWHEQLRRDLWRLARAWDEGYFDYNLADACTTYGGCPFTGLCTSPQPESWVHQFAVKRWNPLEKNPVAEEKAA
jgi:hypothetical protein